MSRSSKPASVADSAGNRQRLSALQALLHREVPLSRHMGVEAGDYDGTVLVLTADLEPNINIHGTTFAGSMYCLAALCGWSLLRLRLEDLSMEAEIVLGTASIDYREPIRGKLAARATCEAGDFDAFAERIRGGRRAGVKVTVTLGRMSDEGLIEPAAEFTGSFARA